MAPTGRRDPGPIGTRAARRGRPYNPATMTDEPGPATPLDAPPDLGAPDLGASVNLVRRAQDGDREALQELVLRYQDRVRRLVRIRMGPTFDGVLDSLDLSQDTWLAALRGLQGLQARDHFSIIA